ncbi:unnamed protein product [Orchesella dallaii]|uniref:Ig-like domain-containing protein n=1 Tax=Orchesella dallaii TaxID=48710 RepID=A0ABP1QZ90_9HEXA
MFPAMEYVRFVFFVSELLLIVRAQPQPQGYDDEVEGEMSVPRAPKIHGPSLVYLNYSGITMENLQCNIEGSPTPTTIWLKDGKEIQSDADSYNTTYDVTDGKAELVFAKNAYDRNNSIVGNFTCIAANFLGRTEKLFIIAQVSADQQSNSSLPVESYSTSNNNSKPNITTASYDETTIASSSIPNNTIVEIESVTLVPINGLNSTSLPTALASSTSGYNSNQTNVISSTVSTASATKILTARLRNSTSFQLPTAPVKESSDTRRSTQNYPDHRSSTSATRE